MAYSKEAAGNKPRLMLGWCPLLGWGLSIVLLFVSQVYHSAYCGEGGVMSFTSIFNISRISNFQLNVSKGNVEDYKEHKYSKDLSHCHAPWNFLTEYHLLDCATKIGRQHEQDAQALGKKAPSPTIAFMFLTRGEIPHEQLWRRFFQGHEELYSLYVHATPNFKYPNDSLFHGHQVPSKILDRLSISLVDAMRRMLAYAVLDSRQGVTNSWFVFLCESSIPIRSFNFTYDYLMRSEHSFVEAFLPVSPYLQWETEPHFHREQLRKGELWMTLQRRHAYIILEDWSLYYKFKLHCNWWCAPDEQYIQTLLALKDPGAIENRTVMYVNWAHEHVSSPFTYNNAKDMQIHWFVDIQGRTFDVDGMYEDTSHAAKETNVTNKSCTYNGVPGHPCFLFARKVSSSATKYLETLPMSVLGY